MLFLTPTFRYIEIHPSSTASADRLADFSPASQLIASVVTPCQQEHSRLPHPDCPPVLLLDSSPTAHLPTTVTPVPNRRFNHVAGTWKVPPLTTTMTLEDTPPAASAVQEDDGTPRKKRRRLAVSSPSTTRFSPQKPTASVVVDAATETELSPIASQRLTHRVRRSGESQRVTSGSIALAQELMKLAVFDPDSCDYSNRYCDDLIDYVFCC